MNYTVDDLLCLLKEMGKADSNRSQICFGRPKVLKTWKYRKYLDLFYFFIYSNCKIFFFPNNKALFHDLDESAKKNSCL